MTVRFVGLKTCTRPGCAQETNARVGVPANTMSEGSLDVPSVARTRIPERLTMLMESEMKFATHTSSAVRNRTEHGSRPTHTLPSETGTPFVRPKTSRRLSGRLQMANRAPSGLSAIGCTGAVSQLKKELVETWPRARPVVAKNIPTAVRSDLIVGP